MEEHVANQDQPVGDHSFEPAPERSNETSAPAKRPYRTPTVTTWGTLQDLTQGNGGTQFDTVTTNFSGHA
jgi:hypothetical protein